MDNARIQELIDGLQDQITEIKEMVDPERSVLTAQYVKVNGPTSSQIIRVSEDGGLDLGNEGNWNVIELMTAQKSHTGDAIKTTVHEITIPADSMGPNGAVRVSSIWHASGAADRNIYYIYFGQIILNNLIGFWDANQYTIDSRPLYVCNTGAANAQRYVKFGMQMHAHSASNVPLQTSAEDTTQDVTIYFQAWNLAAGDTSYLDLALVETLYHN